MLKSSASRTVLALLIVIGAFELGISGKFAQIWQLAFVGKAASSSAASSSSSGVNNPTAASQQAHRSGQ